MDIKNVVDLRDITITKEEYIKLGEINKFLTKMPWNFQGTLEATRYVVDKIVSSPKPKLTTERFRTLDGRLTVGDRVQIRGKRYLTGRLTALKYSKFNAVVMWDGGQSTAVKSSSLEAEEV